MQNFKKKKKGIILILVLWVLFFLSIVVLTLGFKNRINIRLRSLNNEGLRTFYLAQEGINQAFMQLAQDDPKFDCLEDNWGKDFTLQKEGGLLSYKVSDEDRLININKAPQELLINLRLVIPELTDELRGKILKARPYNLGQEIIDKAGVNLALYAGSPVTGQVGLRDIITVFSDGKINLNTAPKEVLLAIPEMSEITAESIINRRQNEPFRKNDTLSEELSKLGLTAQQVSSIIKVAKANSAVFRIKAQANSQRKNIGKTLEVVVSRTPEKLRVLFYKEN